MPGKIQPPVDSMDNIWTEPEKALVQSRVGGSIIGNAETIKAKLEQFVDDTDADELIINAMIYDHAARLRSYEIVADVWREKTSAQTV